MFAKKKLFDNSYLYKNVHTLERLKYLYNVLTKNTIVTEQNKELLIEILRAITELLIYGDQNDPTLFDYFLEKNMLSYFISIAKQDINGSESLSVQLLQTLNILFENIKHETSLYYLLSNNHINYLIQQKFDFTKEEITAYYISFLKTLSFKLNQHTIHFFINEHLDEFPLYTEAIKFFDNPEPMVRIAVQTITLNIFSIQDNNASQHVAKYSGPYFQSLTYSLERNIIKMHKTLLELHHSIKEESHNLLVYKKIPNLGNNKIYGGSVDNINKTDSAQLLACEKIRSSLSSPSTSPKLNLSHKFEDTNKFKKSILLLDSFEETVRQHINKLQYLDDVMSCKGYMSPLSIALGETLINNVFVPLYLLPFINAADSSQNNSNMNKHDIMECLKLPTDLSIFLLTQCFASFPLHKQDAPQGVGNNYVIKQLSHFIFHDKSPSQSILHRLGMKSQQTLTQHGTKHMPDIDRKIYDNIRPNDPVSQQYLLSDQFNKYSTQLPEPIETQREPYSPLHCDISKIYLVLLKTTLKLEKVSGENCYQLDYLPLLSFTLISKILSNIPEAFLAHPSEPPSSNEPLTLNTVIPKIEFPYVLPPNVKILINECVDYIESCSKSDLERIRTYTLYVALVLVIDIIDLVTCHIDREQAVFEESTLKQSYLESSSFTYLVLNDAFARLNSLYSLKLESIINRFKMDDNMFLDLFENQYTLLATLKIWPKRGATLNDNTTNSMLDSSSPLFLLNLNDTSDENLFSHVYKILVASIMNNHSITKNSASLFLYRHLNGIVERVKAEITIFLLLRQFLDTLTNYLTLLSQLNPHPVKMGVNETVAGDMLDPHMAYDRFYKDFSSSCLLPKIGDIIDLSTKDIISCSVEKHLSQGMPYWFLVVGSYDFALVVPHHKKMAHGIIKYVGPLKDIEVAGVTNDPCSLCVRVHRLFNGDDSSGELGSGNKKSKQADHRGSFHTLFKAKLLFEDVIRCQAAKNCLLKGRAKCRRSKSRLLGKMLYAADPIYLPSLFKSFVSPSNGSSKASTSLTTNAHNEIAHLHSTTVDSNPRLENINAHEESKIRNCSTYKSFTNTNKEANYSDSIPLRHFTNSTMSMPPTTLPSFQNYPLTSRKPVHESSDEPNALEMKDVFHAVQMPKRVIPTIPGSARQQPNTCSVYSPSAIRKLTTNLTGRPPSLQKCNAGYSTERLVRSLENHSDNDDLYYDHDCSPPQVRRPLSHVRNRPNTFLDHILSRSNSHGSSINSNQTGTLPEAILNAKNETLATNYMSKNNIKDL